MYLVELASTDLFVGSAAAPCQVIQVTLRDAPPGTRVRIEGPTVSTPSPALVTDMSGVVEVGVRIAAPAPAGSVHRVTVVATAGFVSATLDGQIVAADTGWTMWMVSHFHYDPVWWNTQAGFTEAWYDLPVAEARRPDFNLTAFDLVRAHLDAARQDDDYAFVLAELDYLKPYWDVFPQDRADLRRLLHEGRVELVGGTYNEPNTNLTHPESTVRNAVYGVGYQRDVLGGDPRTAWMLDVFGHDPAFPGLMADAGLDASVWARGPFHHVGALRHTGDVTRMQFPSEFEWISPSGRGLLTGYLANHYVAGWNMERKSTLDEAMDEAYAQFAELRKVAATHHVLLPVGHDHNIPSRWCTEIHRHWPKRYVWPQFKVGLPRDYFAAVRGELAATGRRASPQTRDMGPVYTGKDVSYIDTKQGQRAAEVAVLEAERLSTLAGLVSGHRFPAEALDKAWRQLAYGAHHDAITGTESDQVYLDLLGGWREAYELGADARRAAVAAIAAAADTSGPGRALFAVNPLSWARDGLATVRLRYPAPGPAGVAVRDEEGQPVAALAEGVRRHPEGGLAEATLTFLATDVPALGYRVYRAVDAPDVPAGWAESGTPAGRAEAGAPAGQADAGVLAAATLVSAANAAFLVEVDPARGGALSRILDRRTGRELLRAGGLGGALVRQEEHTTHPVWHEGPWHLLPKEPGAIAGPVEVSIEECAIGRRLVAVSTLGGLNVRHEVLLWDGVDRIDFRTDVDGALGADHLLRVRFDLDAPGALPVAEVGYAAVGRSFGFPNSDAATDLWTLDSPAHTWAGLSATARIALVAPDGTRTRHAIGVAEVVSAEPARDVLARLAAVGVTATNTRPDGARYGALDADSNLPDVRIVLGAGNSFAAQVLAAADPAYRAALARTGAVFIPAARSRRETWMPGADLRGARDLPVLILAGSTVDLAGAEIEVAAVPDPSGVEEPFGGHSVALVNHGTPSFVAEADGTLYLSLMRSCSDWPSGVWIDGERRTAPDGTSFAWQHWTHTFRYSLVAGAGDWRDAGFVRAGQEVNHPVRVDEVPATAGELPARLSLGSVEPASVVLSTLKPRGNPMAAGRPGVMDPAAGVAIRLYESSGAPAVARVRLHGGLREPARTSVLEDVAGPALPTEDGAVAVELGAADVVTLAALPSTPPPASAPGPVQPLAAAAGPVEPVEPTAAAGPVEPVEPAAAQAAEPAQPVYTRYWLHNKGPAPVGYLPVAIHIEQTSVALAGGPEDVLVRVAAASRAARGMVELDVPAGIAASLGDTARPAGALRYDLAAGEYAEFPLSVRADGGAPGTYFLAARIRDDLGQVLEDVVAVTIGPLSSPPAPIMDVTVAPDLTVRVRNLARSELRGEAQVLSPYGTWGGPDCGVAVTPWTQGFAVPPGATGELAFGVAAPATARPGAHWWAVVKVACFGHVHYTQTVPLEVTSP